MEQVLCTPDAAYELWFQSLRGDCPDLHFPCDQEGVVAIDRLSPERRLAYLWARAAIGRNFSRPLRRALGH